MAIVSPDTKKLKIWIPDELEVASLRQNPDRDNILGDIQKRYPFHIGLSLEFISLNL